MNWVEMDRQRVWHPYTQHGLGVDPLPIRGGRGAYLEPLHGPPLLDAISSWWVNVHGHAHPHINRAIAEQADRLEHVIFSGFAHEPAARLADQLVGLAHQSGARSERVFYSDNGSTAVEVALKIAYQAHLNRGQTTRRKFLALQHSYHGDTFGAMAVSEPEGFHSVFRPLLFPVDFVNAQDPGSLERLLQAAPEGYAALIVEPMVQGAGGMRWVSAEFLRQAEKLCREYGVTLICDEVFTGFYRTGKRFAFEHAGLSPDLICVSKGLTGGYLPLSATLATADLYEAFLGSEVSQALLHGHSYTANPVACAAALASLELLEAAPCQAEIARITHETQRHIAELGRRLAPRGTRDARALGTIGAIDLPALGGYGSQAGQVIRNRSRALGVLLRPLGPVVYAVPPYCVTSPELRLIYEVMGQVIEEAIPAGA